MRGLEGAGGRQHRLGLPGRDLNVDYKCKVRGYSTFLGNERRLADPDGKSRNLDWRKR